jgi:hypothetical protein
VTKYVSTGPSGRPDALAADVCAAGTLVVSRIRTAQTPRMVAAVSKSTFISSPPGNANKPQYLIRDRSRFRVE